MQKTLPKRFVKDIIDFCSTNGLILKFKRDSSDPLTIPAPISIFPTEVPREFIEKSKNIQLIFNKLVSRLSHSPEFIHQALAEHAKSDNFVKQLLEISKYYHSESNKWKQDVYLGILRMDYMIEKDEHKIKMIEFNTAASSFGVLFDLTHSLHRYLFTKYKDVIKKPAENIMERNNFKEKAAEAFKQAHLQYLKHDYSGIEEGDTEESKGKCLEERNEVGILFVVQETERNVFDQRPLEYELMKHDITCLRMTFLEIYHNSSLTQNGQLKVCGIEISVVYFRAGYIHDDYFNQDLEWQARKLIECSRAIKCPSIDLQLITFKQFQYLLGQPGVLQKFLEDENECKQIEEVLDGFWSFKERTEEVNKEIEKAIEKPDDFVLKTHREGGANNYYGEELKEILIRGDEKELTDLFLMKKFHPPCVNAYLLKEGKVSYEEIVSEISRYGFFLSTPSQLIQNVNAGQLVRSKTSQSGEGGVTLGFAVIDVPYLTETKVDQNGHIKLDQIQLHFE